MLSKKNKVVNIGVINFIAIASEYQIKLSHNIFPSLPHNFFLSDHHEPLNYLFGAAVSIHE
jgi:hypothetical protein